MLVCSFFTSSQTFTSTASDAAPTSTYWLSHCRLTFRHGWHLKWDTWEIFRILCPHKTKACTIKIRKKKALHSASIVNKLFYTSSVLFSFTLSSFSSDISASNMSAGERRKQSTLKPKACDPTSQSSNTSILLKYPNEIEQFLRGKINKMYQAKLIMKQA